MAANFVNHDPETIYLDGNSLGRLPASSLQAIQRVVEKEWGGELIDAWEHWIDEPLRLGDQLAESFLGASAGTTVLSDSTTVNFYKLAAAAVDAAPSRRVIVTDRGNFPTDRYIVESLAAEKGLEVRWLEDDSILGPQPEQVAELVDDNTALVTLSHVAYRSAAIADMAAINRIARDKGAYNLWDLSHSVGAIPVELEANACDMAVGCTYKYLNGGPGSPAFLFVAKPLQDQLRQPIWGWFGQRDQFAMGEGYQPVDDLRRYLAGTPPIIALAATRAGIETLAELGIAHLRQRSIELTERLIGLAQEHLYPLGFALGSPAEAARRGGHVLLTHPDARDISVALRRLEHVIGDFRAPNGLRLAPMAAYTSDEELLEGVNRIKRMVASGAYRRIGTPENRVT
jgi:kynureninase